MITSNVVKRKVQRHTTVYDSFKGVDFSVDSSLVSSNRSPFAPNMISDIGGLPEKRMGWRTIVNVGEKINGLFYINKNNMDIIVIHSGSKIYKYANNTLSELISGVNDGKSTSFLMQEADSIMMYILTGKEYLKFDGNAITNMLEEGYRPVVVISRNPSGGGVAYEPVNLLTGKREDNFLGNATDKDYYLSSNNIKSVDSVKVLNASGEKEELETSKYTVDLTSGKITFTEAYAPAVSGQDNVFIQYTKQVEGYADRICKCTIVDLYGVGGNNRVFFSGNPDYKAYDWYSELYKANYIPDINYSIVGSIHNAIMGYHKLGDYQMIIKENSQQDSTIFQRQGGIQSDGSVVFSLRQGITGLGAISKYCFNTLIDEPLFLTDRGVYAITSSNILAERTIKNRSYFVDNKLLQENLSNACSVAWQGYYIIAIDGRAYVLDSRNKAYRTNVNNILTNDYIYECYHWENIPAVVFLNIRDELYFGTNDGKLCKFNSDIQGLSKYNDDGEPIVCYWSTKNDDDGATYLYKTLQKQGTMVTIKPFTRSTAKILVSVDGDVEKQLKYGTMDIFTFDDVDFDRFTFVSNDSPQEILIRNKIKKYKRLQFIVKNDTVNEGFGVFKIIKTFTVGNYVRR